MRREKARVHGPYQHGTKWRVHFVTGSGRNRKTTYEVFATWSDAQKCYDEATDEAQGITVGDAIGSYLDFKRAQGRADLTIVAYEERLHLFLADFLKRPLRSIARRGQALYMDALPGRSADTHQNLLTAARLWANWCVKQRWLKLNPFADVEAIGQRVHGGDKERLTIDECRMLEAWCLARSTERDAVVTLAYLYLGPRNTELGRRDVRDLDDGGRLLWIRKTKTAAGRRGLRLPDQLGDMLAALCAGRRPEDPLFVDSRGQRMSRNVARNIVRRVCKEAGVPVVSPQALRRTHATLATDIGETGPAIARALGHSMGGAPRVTAQSYIGADAVSAAQSSRALRVIRGGRA